MGDRGHNRHGPKRWGMLCPFRGELEPHLVQCGLGRGLLSYQVASSSIQPFATIDMGQKLGGGGCAFFSWGSYVVAKRLYASGFLSLGNIVIDGDSATHFLKGHSPQFLANTRCDQTAGWMKMPLGTDVDLGPGHTVLDGDQLPRERGTAAPALFDPCLLWPRSPISATAELL